MGGKLTILMSVMRCDNLEGPGRLAQLWLERFLDMEEVTCSSQVSPTPKAECGFRISGKPPMNADGGIEVRIRKSICGHPRSSAVPRPKSERAPFGARF